MTLSVVRRRPKFLVHEVEGGGRRVVLNLCAECVCQAGERADREVLPFLSDQEQDQEFGGSTRPRKPHSSELR